MRFSFTALTAGLALCYVNAHAIERNAEICAPQNSGEIVVYSLNIVEYPVIYNTYIQANTIIYVDESVTININNAPTYLTTTVSVTTTSTVTKTISTATVTAAPNPTTSAAAQSSSVTSTTYAVAGGSNVGKGVDTTLYTATTTMSASKSASPVSTFVYSNGSTTVTSVSSSTISTSTSIPSGEFTDWTIYKANGVNLGGWLEIEQSNDQYFWDLYAPNATDEWTWCETLGSRCGPILEGHYATYVTTGTIDKLAAVGVNTLRIPTTYAAWIDLSWSELYHGNQQAYLSTITNYAIDKYGMRVIIGLHSLPGGVNDLDIGEASGHDDWFYNSTNLAYSYEAVNAVLSFIEASNRAWAFTIAPINEASDNIAGFATPTTLTSNGTAWVVNYIQGVISRTTAVDQRIPVMLQDCFLGEEHWSPYFPTGTNLVIDTHVYYFAASGVYSGYATGAICGQASVVGGDGKFPVFIGEWSLQTLYNNTFANRETLFNTQRWAWEHYVQGGAFWAATFNGTAAVDGEGVQRDYWSYIELIDDGVINSPIANATYC